MTTVIYCVIVWTFIRIIPRGNLGFLRFTVNCVVFLRDGLTIRQHRHTDSFTHRVFRRTAHHGEEVLSFKLIQPDFHHTSIRVIGAAKLGASAHMLGHIGFRFSIGPLNGQGDLKIRMAPLAVGRPICFEIGHKIIIHRAVMPVSISSLEMPSPKMSS